MKFAHISDLHLGKRVHQFSMIEEQKYILEKIVEIAAHEAIDGILIAGDVYDKVYPSAEAVALFDSFLVQLAKENIKVFVISGNHDSPERIAFLGQLTQKAGVYLSPVFDGEVKKVTLEDEYGPINVYLLPFIKPVHVRHFYPGETVTNYTQAMEVVVKHMGVNQQERNILLAHQFVTGAMRSDSEEISVGGLDNVEVTAFEDFDYVALGHIHRPQTMGRDSIRYSGTPLKYSFSECQDKKSLTILEVKQKRNGKNINPKEDNSCSKEETAKTEIDIKIIPLEPLHDMTKIRGNFLEVMNPANFPDIDGNSYLHITLTDEQDVPEAFRRLSDVYPNLMQMEYDNTRTRQKREVTGTMEMAKRNPLEMFATLYETMNNQPLNEVQQEYIQKKIDAIWKGEA
ncbi:MAG: exonuclease SbcCD subunit D [Lachnospiraceae bacterium]|nr:exonuclease SbcCD subunit D [Lachnospiraceae bacterium]